MPLAVEGPGVGERIGQLCVRTDQGDPITLANIPGDMIVVNVFRGHW